MRVFFLLRLVEEDGNALTELPAYAFIISFQVIGSKVRPTECGFEGVDIVDLEILPHCHTRSPFLVLLHIETAVLVLIRLMQFLHEKGKLLRPCSCRRILSFLTTTIEEDVFLAGVAMHVDVHHHFPLPI